MNTKYTSGKNPPASQKTGWRITVLLILIGLVGAGKFLRFFLTIPRWRTLSSLLTPAAPWYLAGDGLFWGMIGVLLIRGVWLGRTWARPAVLLLCALFAVQRWLELWLAPDPLRLQTRWGITLAGTLIILGGVSYLLYHPESTNHFQQENQP